jgi:hypothetical protein
MEDFMPAHGAGPYTLDDNGTGGNIGPVLHCVALSPVLERKPADACPFKEIVFAMTVRTRQTH